MRAKFINTLVKHDGKTSDIAGTVIKVYNKDYQQVNELVQGLKSPQGDLGGTAETCENIFNYVIKNVRYSEDPFGVQWVKTPARLVADGVGDCKSMAIFICSCLRCLNIPHFFRFVSFSNRKEATHVYAVALDENGKEIYIDPVVRPIQFNKQEKYTYKSDMAGTDIYYMAGIRGAAISKLRTGSAISEPQTDLTHPDRFRVWNGDIPDLHTKPKMNLCARLDLLLEVSLITPQNKLAEIYNQLDMLSLAIYAYERSYEDKELFEKYVWQIAAMSADGFFSGASTDLDYRSENLTALKETLTARLYDDFEVYDKTAFDWLKERVLDVWEAPGIHGIGSAGKAQEIADNLKKGGPYYIYTFVPNSSLPLKALAKKQGQGKIAEYVNSEDKYHDSAAITDLNLSGCIAAYGAHPTDFLKTSRPSSYTISGTPQVGGIMAIIGVITAILGLIQLLVDLFAPKRPKPSDEEINSYTPNFGADGFSTGGSSASNNNNNNGSNQPNPTKADISTYLPYVLVGAAALTMFSKN